MGLAGRPARPYRLSMRLESWFEQMEACARAEEAMLQGLRDKGWVWDQALQHWAHPDHPDTIISH